MTLETFFKKFDTIADAPNAVAKMLAPLPGCVMRRAANPVVSLRSTTGYKLESLRDGAFRVSCLLDAGGIPACSRWSSEARATPPVLNSHFIRTPPGVPACAAHP
jgi:hypothetical protein